MKSLNIRILGPKIREKRGRKGLRETAAEIGIGSATLSRLERGNVPDLDTFQRVCNWLAINPGSILGLKSQSETDQPARVHFRKEATTTPEAAQDLAHMILAAQKLLHQRRSK